MHQYGKKNSNFVGLVFTRKQIKRNIAG